MEYYRINSWCNYDTGEGIDATQIDLEDLILMKDSANYLLQHVPIPITPDRICKAFGFKKAYVSINGEYYQIPEGRFYGICFNQGKISFYKYNAFGIDTLIDDQPHFQHIHHLQNVWEALNGEDLKLINKKALDGK